MTPVPLNSTFPQIAPSILSADFARLADEIDDVERGGAGFLHFEIIDGHFPSHSNFGPVLGEATRPCTGAFLDTRLMIPEPVRYTPAFLKAGVDGIPFHVEVVDD